MKNILCFDEDLNVVNYCFDVDDFQIPFASDKDKDRILSVMSDLKQLLNGSKIDRHNKKFIETATILKLREMNNGAVSEITKETK